MYDDVGMGMAAERCAEKSKVSRQEQVYVLCVRCLFACCFVLFCVCLAKQNNKQTQDDFTIASYKRAQLASKDGAFKPEIVPVEAKQGKESKGPCVFCLRFVVFACSFVVFVVFARCVVFMCVCSCGHRRGNQPSTCATNTQTTNNTTQTDAQNKTTKTKQTKQVDFAKLLKLPSPFVKNGSVTAASSSKISDGAAALVCVFYACVVCCFVWVCVFCVWLMFVVLLCCLSVSM